MARKKHQYFWVIETFSTDSTAKLSRAAFWRLLERLVGQATEQIGFWISQS